MSDPTHAQIAATPMPTNDAGAATIGDYLRVVFCKVWVEEQMFNGKRPFGNSGWQSEVYRALFDAGYIAGELDSEGWLDTVDTGKADELILNMIVSITWEA